MGERETVKGVKTAKITYVGARLLPATSGSRGATGEGLAIICKASGGATHQGKQATLTGGLANFLRTGRGAVEALSS